MRCLDRLTSLAVALLLATATADATAPALLPVVGPERLPDAAAPICPIPFVDQSFDSTGPAVGDLVHDASLFSDRGERILLSSMLASGRHLLLVAGSYSCPVFRATLPALNDIAARFRGRVDVLVVYVLEPHPVVDPSPYFGVENVTTQNRYEDILVRQPRTWGERRALVDSLRRRFTIDAPIAIDGPCNEWWTAFGQAPNNALLIAPDGRVAAKHGWFNREPLDMAADIARALGEGRDDGRGDDPSGAFTLRLRSATDTTGDAGSTFTYQIALANADTVPVRVVITRLEEDLPAGWRSSFCSDVCQPPTVSSDQLYIGGRDERIIAAHIFTDERPSSGSIRLRIENAGNAANAYEVTFAATTVAAVARVGGEEEVVVGRLWLE